MALGQVFVPAPTPFNLALWDAQLADYVIDVDGEIEFRGQFIYEGLANGGFDIGVKEGFDFPPTVESQLPSLDFGERYAVTHWIINCVRKGFAIGPFLPHQVPQYLRPFKLSPVFTVPKPNNNDLVKRFRVVHHLSHPDKHFDSVNSIIRKDWTNVHYTSFYEVVSLAYALGPGAWLWAVDAQDAFYRVPIKKKYWSLLGLSWLGRLFFFVSLPMGLSSACQIYNKFADAIEYIIVKNHKRLFTRYWRGQSIQLMRHYLDDFFGGHWSRRKAKKQFDLVQEWMAKLGIPTKPSKCIKPARVQKWLGWLYNTLCQTISIPVDKIVRYRAYIAIVLQSGKAHRKQLQKLIGILQWAAVAIFPGKAWIRRLEVVLHYNFDESVPDGKCLELPHFVLEDLRWWYWALGELNQIRFEWILVSASSRFDVVVWTDAASEFGVGGWSSTGYAFQVAWKTTLLAYAKKRRSGLKIQFMELLGLIVAAKLWAHQWPGKIIEFKIDNPGAHYACQKKGAALWRHDMNFLVRELAMLAVEYKFKFWVTGILGKDNVTADALSRFYCADQFDLNRFDYMNDDARCIVNELLAGVIRQPLNGRHSCDWTCPVYEYDSDDEHIHQ